MSTKKNNLPTHTLFHIQEKQNGKSFWQEVGAAWTNSDGSLNVVLDYMPRGGWKFQLRLREEKADRLPGEPTHNLETAIVGG